MFLDSNRASRSIVIDPRLEQVMLVELDRLDRLARMYLPRPADQPAVIFTPSASASSARWPDRTTSDEPRSDPGQERRAA
jgi:hypothetical protein